MQHRQEGPQRSYQPDLLLRLLPICALVGWACLIAAMFLTAMAKPDSGTPIDYKPNVPQRLYWDRHLLGYAFYLLWPALGLSICGLIMNYLRVKRKDDFVRISLILLGALSAIGLVTNLTKF